MKRLHKVALVAVTLEALGVAYSFALLPRLRRWGATADEVSRPLPGDELVPDPLYTTTHAITVRASAEAVWPWLVQIGQNRGGFYTYDAAREPGRARRPQRRPRPPGMAGPARRRGLPEP